MHLCARANAKSECGDGGMHRTNALCFLRANTCTSGTLPPSASPLARRRSPPSCAPACAGLAPRRQPHGLGRATTLGAGHRCTSAAPERPLRANRRRLSLGECPSACATRREGRGAAPSGHAPRNPAAEMQCPGGQSLPPSSKRAGRREEEEARDAGVREWGVRTGPSCRGGGLSGRVHTL